MVHEIPQGKKKQLVDRHDAGNDNVPDAYVVEVSGAPIRIAHNEQTTDEGIPIAAGDRVKLSNLRGMPVYAEAFEGDATVDMTYAGVDVQFMQRESMDAIARIDTINEVQSSDVSDRAAREIGKARMQDSGGTLIDPATEQTVSSELSREISSWSAGVLDTSVTIDTDNVGLAKDATVSSELSREISSWTAGVLDASVTIDTDNVGLAKDTTVSSEQPREIATWSAGEIGTQASIANDSVGLAKDTTVSSEQPRSIDTDNVGLAKDSTLSSEQPRSVSELTGNAFCNSDTVTLPGSFQDTSLPDGMSAVFKAREANTDPVILCGDFALEPGKSVELRPTNFNDVSISGTDGDVIDVIAPGGS